MAVSALQIHVIRLNNNLYGKTHILDTKDRQKTVIFGKERIKTEIEHHQVSSKIVFSLDDTRLESESETVRNLFR